MARPIKYKDGIKHVTLSLDIETGNLYKRAKDLGIIEESMSDMLREIIRLKCSFIDDKGYFDREIENVEKEIDISKKEISAFPKMAAVKLKELEEKRSMFSIRLDKLQNEKTIQANFAKLKKELAIRTKHITQKEIFELYITCNGKYTALETRLKTKYKLSKEETKYVMDKYGKTLDYKEIK